MRKIRSSEKGAAMVEFAFVLPLLLIIVFGAIEFGVLMYNQQVITNASREGARAGIVSRRTRVDVDTISSVARNYCAANLVTFGTENIPTVDVTGYSEDPDFGDNLQVDVNYRYSFLVIPDFIPGINRLLDMQATTVMRYE
jgi:Flp pilus assembly protein TadG